MRILTAAALSAALLVTPVIAPPTALAAAAPAAAVHKPDPDRLRPAQDKLKHAPARPHSLAEAAAAGWEQTERDGITLLSRRSDATVTPGSGGGAATRSDFDGDGRDDVAGFSDDGVLVTYSSAPFVDQLRTDLPLGGCICFGFPMVSGNFNGDAFDDLAVADQDEIDRSAGDVHAGAVWIFPGSATGLRVDQVQHVNQSTPDVPGSAEADDWFGASLAAGDITGDGRDDLAVGLPNEAIGSTASAGGVIVLKGSPAGVVGTGAVWIDQGTAGVPGSPETGDSFGWSVAIGKVDKNAAADLVVGTPLENNADSNNGSGMVTLFWGGTGGVSLTGVTSTNGEGVTAAAKIDGMFAWNLGIMLGVTDTNGDGFGEVIVGDSGAEVGFKLAPGAVFSLAGRGAGLTATGVKVLSQDTAGVAGATEDEDFFGDAIAVGDLTGDGLGDVLVGVPGEDIGTTADAGSVVLLRGSSGGLTGTGSQSLDQSSALVPGSAEARDTFGEAVTALNLNGAGPLEALVGTPNEEVGDDPAGAPSGTVTSFPVGSGGLGTGVTTPGKSLVPAGETTSRYGLFLSGPQGA